MFQPHRDFCLGIGATGDRMHVVKRQLRLMGHDRPDRIEKRINGPVTGILAGFMAAIDVEGDRRLLGSACSRNHRQRDHLDPVVCCRHLIVDQCLDILVEHVLFLVGQILEPAEGVGEGIIAQFVTQFGQFLT